MKNTIRMFMIIVLLTIVGFFLAGCENLFDNKEEAVTIKFLVFNQTIPPQQLTGIEFINGSSYNDPVLATYNITLNSGAIALDRTVSGFTKNHWGVRATSSSGKTYFVSESISSGYGYVYIQSRDEVQ